MDLMEKVKLLRARSSVGIGECKEALQKANGDVDAALSLLRQRGAMLSQKKAARSARQGLIESYVHFSGNMGAMVEVNCETDFVARTDVFRDFVKNLALHIAAAAPLYMSEDDIPQGIVENLSDEVKKTYVKENCLLSQPFVKDNSTTIKDYLHDAINKTGENVVIKRFVRYALGENEEGKE